MSDDWVVYIEKSVPSWLTLSSSSILISLCTNSPSGSTYRWNIEDPRKRRYDWLEFGARHRCLSTFEVDLGLKISERTTSEISETKNGELADTPAVDSVSSSCPRKQAETELGGWVVKHRRGSLSPLPTSQSPRFWWGRWSRKCSHPKLIDRIFFSYY